MSHVFLSYARPDQARAQAFAQALQTLGHDVWWDHDIQAGTDFGQSIEKALDQAACVVVLWSQHSIRSRWVLDESGEALESQRLVPVLIDDVKPPLGFRRIEAAKLTGWKGSHEHPEFRILMDAIGRFAEQGVEPVGVEGRDGLTRMPPPEPISEPEVMQSRTDRMTGPADVAGEALRGKRVRIVHAASRGADATAASQVLGVVGATVNLAPMGPGVHDVHLGRAYYQGPIEVAFAAGGLLEHIEALRPTHLADAPTDHDLILCLVERVTPGASVAAKGIRGVRVRIAHTKELTDHARDAADILKGSGAIATLKTLGRAQEGNRGRIHYARDQRSAQAVAEALGELGDFGVERLDHGDSATDVLVWLIAAGL